MIPVPTHTNVSEKWGMKSIPKELFDAIENGGIITLGVGDGNGNLYVFGDYESIKRAQWHIFERERLAKEVDRLEKALAEQKDRADDYEHIFDLQAKRERPYIEIWRNETGKHDCIPDYGKFIGWLIDRIERKP